MKKLMVAAAIICAACFTQAAQYTWEASTICSGFQSGYEEQNAKGTAYLFLNGGDTTLALVQAAISDGSFLSGGWGAKALDYTGFNGDLSPAKTSEDGLAGATGDSFFAVFVADSWTPYDAGEGGKVDPIQAFIGSSKTPVEVKSIGPTSINFGSQYSLSSDGGNWYTQSAPEPTSGLLLLIGMAGIALRRRRA